MEENIKTVLTCMIQQLKVLPNISSLTIQGKMAIIVNDVVHFDVLFSEKKKKGFDVYHKDVNRSLECDEEVRNNMQEDNCYKCQLPCDELHLGAVDSTKASVEGSVKKFESTTQKCLALQPSENFQLSEILPNQQSPPNKQLELRNVTMRNSVDDQTNQIEDRDKKVKGKNLKSFKIIGQQHMSSVLFYKKLGVKTRQRQSKSTKAAETRCLESSSKSPVSSSSSSSSNIVEHSAEAFDDRSHSKDCRQEDSQREEVETRSLSCPTCHKCYPFSSQVTFNRHVRRHSQHVQCEVCGKWLASLDSLGQHQRGLHGNIKPYICNECGQTFSFRHSYNVHMHKHTGVRPYKCSQCSKTYLTASHLKTHVISQHSGRGQEPQFQCETCGRSFLWASNLKTHQLIHTDVRPFQCSICSKGFTTKQALRLHNQSYHENERKFECDVCHKFYKSERLRNIHKRRHSSADFQRFMCDICGQQFMFKSSLETHKHTHGEERPHVCKVCGKSFKLVTSLYTHQFTHSDDKPFQCRICTKAFKTRTCCQAHERRHNASKAFTCAICSARFPDKGGLSKHVRTIHAPTRLFHCTICGKQGARMDNMRSHLKSHARDVSIDNPTDYIKETSSQDLGLYTSPSPRL